MLVVKIFWRVPTMKSIQSREHSEGHIYDWKNDEPVPVVEIQQFNTVQSAASFLNHFHTDEQYNNLRNFAERYLKENYSSLTLPELKVYFRVIENNNNFNELAKEWHKRSRLQERRDKEAINRNYYAQLDEERMNAALKQINDLYTDYQVPDEFMMNTNVIEDDNKVHIEINLDERPETVENMVYFI